MVDSFQTDHDIKLKFSGFISVAERIISVKFHHERSQSPEMKCPCWTGNLIGFQKKHTSATIKFALL